MLVCLDEKSMNSSIMQSSIQILRWPYYLGVLTKLSYFLESLFPPSQKEDNDAGLMAMA